MKLIRISGNQLINLENIATIELKPRNHVIYFDGEGYSLTPDRYRLVECNIKLTYLLSFDIIYIEG